MSCTPDPAVQSDDTGQRIPFLTAVKTWMSIRMSTIKLNTDCLCLGHPASNAWSLQEIMHGHYKKTANESVCTVVTI